MDGSTGSKQRRLTEGDMTQLRKPVIREVSATVRDAGRVRPLVIRLIDAGLELRQKGCRTTYLLPYGVAWIKAAQLAADARRAERKQRKKAGDQ